MADRVHRRAPHRRRVLIAGLLAATLSGDGERAGTRIERSPSRVVLDR